MIHKIFTILFKYRFSWWFPIAAGLLSAITLPPFNHEFLWVFSLCPFMSFAALCPLLYYSIQAPLKKPLLKTYLCAFGISLSQCFWVAFVKIEGLWGIIIIGMVLLSLYVALFYFVAGVLFRFLYKRITLLLPICFPACWVIIDYSRTLTDLAFPWAFMGYTITPILPLSQTASITGVWGITYLILTGNVILFFLIQKWYTTKVRPSLKQLTPLIIFVGLVVVLSIRGAIIIHMKSKGVDEKTVKCSLLQPNLDQLRWGNYSINETFTLFDSLIYKAAECTPDVIIGPESSLLCYLSRQRTYRRRFQKWADSTNIPILLGSLHWDKPEDSSIYDYLVYNTAFMAYPGKKELSLYRKIKLVPFSEIFPFEANAPILSRVNLGEADFKRGKEDVVFPVGNNIVIAPHICYDIIFPGFVQRRLNNGVNLIAHITNDGWFGKTSGPYQHAEMARMRAIENCVSVIQCAITGITMFIDPVGHIRKRTKLDERVIVTDYLPLRQGDTLYARYGDWFVVLCGVVMIPAIVGCIYYDIRKRNVQKVPQM